MLLNSRMASIPCSTRHSISYVKDIEHLFKRYPTPSRLNTNSHSATTGLLYFNMRVTQRLRRYRSLKRQWHEVATFVQNTSLSPKCESPSPQETTKNFPVSLQKTTNEPRSYCINDYINATTTVAKDYNEKNSVELDPLHTRIQQDLIKLRKFIKAKQRKDIGNVPLKTPTSSRPSGEATSISTAANDQENHCITIVRKASSLNKLKPLDRIKIAGCQMHPPILLKNESTDSGIGSTSNASSTCSQYSKQQQQQKFKRSNNNKTFNIYHSRVNPPPPPLPPLPSDSLLYRSSLYSKKKIPTSARMSQNISSKQLLPSRLSVPIPPIEEKKQPSFTKQETILPPIRRASDSDDTTTRPYTYAASTSSSTPCSMILKRNTSLLPILLESCSCMGIQRRESQPKKVESDLEEEEEEEEQEQEQIDDSNEDNDYYYLLNYNHLINRLPKPIVSIHPRYGQDEYGILFEQLGHIRETMPDTNIYDDYTRIV